MRVIGLAATVTGAAFAIWARLALGRNWSGVVVTVKDQHQLVTSGPYAIVRHPIYAGLFLMAMASAIIAPLFGTITGTVMLLCVFLLRIQREERMMTLHFGQQYDAYRQRIARLIPYIW